MEVGAFIFNRQTIIHGFWYCLTALLLYFGAKAPIMVFFTDYLHLWYVFSGALSGIIVTLAGFAVTEFCIYNPNNPFNKLLHLDRKKKKTPVI
jgi:hypothetical protein